MKKLTLSVLILILLSCFTMTAEENPKANTENKSANGDTKIEQSTDDQSVAPEKKKHKVAFFKRIKERFKRIGPEGKIGPFLLGFLLGLIGVLIVFLVNYNKPERKEKCKFAWLGWLWWLVILCIIMAAA